MKKCPFCAEEIQDEAIVCRYCGRDLPHTRKGANSGSGPTYTFEENGQRFEGSLETLRKWAAEQKVLRNTLVWKPGMKQFAPASQFPELADALPADQRSEGCVALLGLFAVLTTLMVGIAAGSTFGSVAAAVIALCFLALELALFAKHLGGVMLRLMVAVAFLGFGIGAMLPHAAQKALASSSVSARSEGPKSTSISVTPEGLTHISGSNRIGCQSKEYLGSLTTYAVQGDNQAFSRGLAAGISTGECTMFRDGETVFIADSSVLSGLVKVRRQGETAEYWTNLEAVK